MAGLPQPHARGYTEVDGRLVDATLVNPSLDWAAGEMISAADDVNRFFDALLGGRLTSQASLAAMRQTREGTARSSPTASVSAVRPAVRPFGVGARRELIGYLTHATRADDGRRATLSYNPLPPRVPADAVVGLFSSVYC